MKVLIYINYQGKEYFWDDLLEKQKKEFRTKLNNQTANVLGYKQKEFIENRGVQGDNTRRHEFFELL